MIQTGLDRTVLMISAGISAWLSVGGSWLAFAEVSLPPLESVGLAHACPYIDGCSTRGRVKHAKALEVQSQN